MKDTEIKKLLFAHIFCVVSIILSTVVPSFFLENFSVLGTHLTWLCICSACVTTVNIFLYIIVKPNPSSKRSSFAHKVRLYTVKLTLRAFRENWRTDFLYWRNQVGKWKSKINSSVSEVLAKCSTFWNGFLVFTDAKLSLTPKSIQIYSTS